MPSPTPSQPPPYPAPVVTSHTLCLSWPTLISPSQHCLSPGRHAVRYVVTPSHPRNLTFKPQAIRRLPVGALSKSRVIRLSLSARPQPSAPPSQQACVPLAKHILQWRLIRPIFLYTALTYCIQAFIWTVWLLGGVEQLGSSTFVAPFYPYTLLLAGTTWWRLLCQLLSSERPNQGMSGTHHH